MNDELIRKSDVLDLLDDLELNLIDYDIYSQLFDTVGLKLGTAYFSPEKKPRKRWRS